MRVKVRDKLDLSYPVKLEDLTPLDRVVVAIRARYLSSRLYKNRLKKESEMKQRVDMQRREELRNILLYNISEYFIKVDKVDKLTLNLSREFDDILDDTLTSVDFMSYTIVRRTENPDYLLSFPDLPILLDVERAR